MRVLGKNVATVAALLLFGMIAVWGFSLLGVSTLVAFPLFVLGIVVASLESDSGIWGAGLGVLYLVAYDLFFTMPMYELKVLSRTDIVALVIFLLVALIMNTVTRRMRRQVDIAERSALAMGQFSKFSASLIDSTSCESACESAQDFLEKALDRRVTITLGKPTEEMGPLALD